MTNPELDFDDGLDISKILRDIDAANEALDSLDVRADALTATLNALLRAQSQTNPYSDMNGLTTEAISVEMETEAVIVTGDEQAPPASMLTNGQPRHDSGGEA